MRTDDIFYDELDRVEREARRLRAEVTRNAIAKAVAWVRGVFALNPKTARRAA